MAWRLALEAAAVFPFILLFLLPFYLPLASVGRLAFVFVPGKFTLCHGQERAGRRVINRSEDMFVSVCLFLGAGGSVAIH